MTDEHTESDGPAEILSQEREEIERLACPDGDFHVACARTGARPEPVAGVQFATADDADAAASAARRYRAALAELDPGLAPHDLVAYETDRGPLQVARVRSRTSDRRANGLPRSRLTVTVAGERDDEWLRIENCPVVHLAREADPLDDEVVGRQLDSKLGPDSDGIGR